LETRARAISSLSSLSSLDLGGNLIRDEGARAISSLSSLSSLDLRFNYIGDEGARAISSLSSLSSLDLCGNDIGAEGARAILDAWLHEPMAGKREILDLTENGDLSSVLPPELMDTRDAQALLAAYRAYRDARGTLQPINEAKLLVLGNEAVGKTSLVRYLIKGAPRDQNEPKTPGAAIHEKIDTHTWSPEQSGVTLNVWDFGGQEIMHGTHRFFLTERSLYLLVLEARREDDSSVYDWLKIIRNRGGNSPVIVVINKCDDGNHNLRLDETSLRRDYPGLVAIVNTTCNPGDLAERSIAGLRRLIATTLADDERLRHVRDPMPPAWLRVKHAIAELARQERIMPMGAFESLCDAKDATGSGSGGAITDENEQRALLRLLHDLGTVVAHGLSRDASAAQQQITLLDPNWLTTAIYTLLISRRIADARGEFSRQDLRDLLPANEYPEKWHSYILDMMQHRDIGMCFRLPNRPDERYLIPEALPYSAPDYSTWPADSLLFRFQYELLPRGLIPRFIVHAHDKLTDTPTAWQTGAVFHAVNCKILVLGDRDRRRIDMSVTGPVAQRRSALQVILDRLDFVHGLNSEIGATALVPLPDEPALDVPYEHLLKLEERYGSEHAFDPVGARRAYTVRELLDGVRHDRNLENRAMGDIHTRDNARITIVHGDIRSSNGDVHTNRNGDIPVDRGRDASETEPPQEESGISWPWLSIACGIGAMALVVVLWLLPQEWRAPVAGVLAVGLIVFAVVMSFNPKYFFRRWLVYVITGGFTVTALGFTLDAGLARELDMGWLRWSGTVSHVFYAAWALLAAGLIVADVKTQK
jgi:internalin A